MRDIKHPAIRCQAFNQYLECCIAQATKLCTDDAGLQWYACDAPMHDTKTGSYNVDVAPLREPTEALVEVARAAHAGADRS